MRFPLTGHGVCIRPFAAPDAPAFAAAVRESVATVGAWMPWCHADYSVDEALLWFGVCRHNIDASDDHDLGIFAPDGVDLLGGIGINQIDREHGLGNVGYWVRESRQGRGVATRALRVMLPFGFGTLGLTRLEIVAAAGNLASRRVAEKAGAELECLARNRLIVNDRPCTAAVYSLLPADTDTDSGTITA